MLAQAAVEFFKHKVVSSIIVLACWPATDQMRFTRQLSQYGMSATFSCEPAILDKIHPQYLQGVLYMIHEKKNLALFKKVKRTHFTKKYKWLLLGDHVPEVVRDIRYDSDVTFLEWCHIDNNETKKSAGITQTKTSKPDSPIYFYDVYVHPRDGIAINYWAHWTKESGFLVTHEREKILRRLDLKRYPLRIATPVGHYSSDKYDGTFVDYLKDESMSDQDPGIRSAHSGSMLLTEAVNAQAILIENELWATVINNNSMYLMLSKGQADLAGGVLRILLDRIYKFDYVMTIWPFRVGFTYLAERESSSNMYLEPFSPGVWWSCLGIMAILAMVEWVTAKTPREREGALYTVLTTWLQQDASAVPEGASGRWAFTVLSISAMLVHAYYTSAIVSALMSNGRGGPETLKALGDSKYAIASEDYDYMRYLFFDVETTWDELEYLKKKKKTSKFYQELERGVELIQQGSTAFHSEYNQIYPHFKKFSDDQICKLQHVDTIPESLSWVTSTKNGQWTEVLRSAGGWLLETGLQKRVINRLRIPQPPCRASLLAERVKLGDIAPLLALTIFGAILSVVMLGIEIMYAKSKGRKLQGRDAKRALDVNDESSEVTEVEYNYLP
uniref:Ionotropic glutamate receptor C-terminal domain-containing protein n=1 Tax=Heliothis virescens TaxID=7102 RepID=A0A2A4K3Y1_HELVI